MATMLKAVPAQEDRPAAREKAHAVIVKLRSMRWDQSVAIVRAGREQMPSAHYRSIVAIGPVRGGSRQTKNGELRCYSNCQ